MLESLDNSILLGFIEEAQSYTPTIRAGIVAFQADNNRLEEIQLAYRQVHTIKGAALMIGMGDLSELAETIESALEKFQNGDGALDLSEADYLLAQLEQIERALESAAVELQTVSAKEQNDVESMYATDFAADLARELADDSAVNFSFEAFEQPQNSGSSQSSSAAESLIEALGDPEDLDPEMLEIFALEAEEHLQNISANLQILEQNAQDREALQNIRRSAHTLKGAAGVVGFKTTSHLAHRMEDLLDHLAEHPLSSTAQTTALLLASTDALEHLSRGATREQIKAELENLYARFDDILPRVNTLAVSSTNESTNFIKSEAISKSEIQPEDENKSVFAEPLFEESEIRNEPAGVSAIASPRTVIRVGLDRLDEMVKLMGEMVISRTILEQRLKDIESQLSEMRLSTNRLRRIAGKLEVDYEASALAGNFKNSAKSFAPAYLTAQQISASNLGLETNGGADKHGFDDLEFDRYTEFHELTRQLVETSTDTTSVTGELDDLLGDLDALLTRQRRLSDDLQEKMMRLRMVPLGTLATRLYRTVRVTADTEDKQVDLDIEGEEVEIDTQVLNSLTEPLLHLLRNAVVHGIESSDARKIDGKPTRGKICLRAFYEGTNIVLAISDDGRGMNPDKLRAQAVRDFFLTSEEAVNLSDEAALQLVFLPGFSTASRINENAGRGVGMDIVRESVQRQQGSISIKSMVGNGTTMLIRLPMSLAVTRALLVRAFGQRFAIPLNVILSLSQASSGEFNETAAGKSIVIADKAHPVRTLNELLDLPAALTERDEDQIPTLLVQIGEKTIALVLDEVVEAREVVIKPLEGLLKDVRGLLGSTILGDGSVVPILDLVSLIQPETVSTMIVTKPQLETVVEKVEIKPAIAPPIVAPTLAKPPKSQLSIMIVDDSPSVRRVMTNLITKTGWRAVVAKDGLEAVEILETSRELPDVILSDVEMPRMDGYELLSTLKRQENLQHLPVVMITSRAGDKHRQRALDLGASEYVVKPYQDSVLLETIRHLAS